jgi:hypothetical protein
LARRETRRSGVWRKGQIELELIVGVRRRVETKMLHGSDDTDDLTLSSKNWR